MIRGRGRDQGAGTSSGGAGTLSGGRGRCQGGGDVTVTSLLQSPSRAMLLLQCCRIGKNNMPLRGA